MACTSCGRKKLTAGSNTARNRSSAPRVSATAQDAARRAARAKAIRRTV